MPNKSSKIIFLFLSTILMVSLITYIRNENPLGWRDVNGFAVKITGDIEQIEEFYTSLEQRLIGYPDWVNIVLTGELVNFQKDYAPFRTPLRKFENFNKVYTSIDIAQLLTEYSVYLESVLLNTQNPPNRIAFELNRLYQFCSILNTHFVKNKNMFVGDIIDVMKFDINPYYNPIGETHTIYIFLHEGKDINSQLEQIINQIQVEINDLNRSLDISASIINQEFQITNLDTLVLLEDYEKYELSQYSHVYKYLPSINSTEFNLRMSVMKQSIHHDKFSAISTAAEFLVILSTIEEQLIEFQFRAKFHNKKVLKFINKLVGDGESEFGILTSMINLLDDRRYRYRVKDYLSKSAKYLKSETKNITELTYPTTQSLPNNVLSKYIDENHAIILKIK